LQGWQAVVLAAPLRRAGRPGQVVLRGLVCAGDDGAASGQRGATGHAAQRLAGWMEVGGGWHCSGLWRD